MEAKMMKVAIANLKALIEAETEGDNDCLRLQMLKATLEILQATEKGEKG